MRKLLCLALLAACELKPPPKKQPPPPPAATPTPAPSAGSDAGSAAPRPAQPTIEISAPCLEVATKIVQVLVDNATDAGQKSVYEQARTTMIRKTGEACTQQGWSDQARACYAAAKKPTDIQACETKFTPPPSAQPPAAQQPAPGARPE